MPRANHFASRDSFLRPPRSSRSSHARTLAALVVIAFLALLSGCSTETLFRSKFDSTPVGSFPSPNQDIGTAAVDGPPSDVVVVTVPSFPGRWVRVVRPTSNGPTVGFQGRFSKLGGDGEYTFAATVLVTNGSGAATLQCETFGQPASVLTSFLHLDFMPDGQVRIDDGALFGHFTHDQPFIVQVRLKIGPSVGTADIALAGDGASGTATHTIPTALRSLARQFGAVRVWIGSPHVGTVIATNISVTRDK